MTPEDLEKLLVLAEQAKARDLAVYAQQVQEKQALEQARAELDARRQGSAAFVALARWQNWVCRERERLTAELQRIGEAMDDSRARAVRASARVQALEMLLERARLAALRQNRRRAEQNGVPPDA